MRRTGPVFLLLVALVAVGFPLRAEAATSASPIAQDRSVEPVVLTGLQFPGWSAGPEISAREPTQPPNSGCPNHESDGLNHNCSQPSRIPNNPNVGTDVDRLAGYRWDSGTNAYKEIPFQVDERFTRYISNLASNCTSAGPFCVGFGAYAGNDAQLSYVFDRDTYKFTEGVCSAAMKPGDHAEADPVKGLDDNDELAFLYRDAGQQAPVNAPLPAGIAEMKGVRIDDPSAPDAAPQYAYVGRASGPVTHRFTATNSYMRYVRDADADRYDQTSGNYGNAPKGTICDAAGNVIRTNVPRRPRDTAWVLTPRYAFRYAGRWILRGVRVAPGTRNEPLAGPGDYGPPLLDQWKARAYAQTPEDEVPCCGFETEQDNWGGSSVTLGERSGPIRVIRATWGADSGTNTVRHEIFYPDLILQQTNLRVHPIPPLGGIFSYWDHSAGVITKYFNPQHAEGVKVDGKNDEVVGTMHVAVKQGGLEVRDDDPVPVVGPQDVKVGDGPCLGECSNFDVTDPTLNASGVLTWEQVSGQYGSMVFRNHLNQVSPGNVQSLASIPYYRDDACFDDGTGIDPGPHIRPKDPDPERPCWKEGDPAPDPQLRQGLIGAHGVQVLFAAETDNLSLTVPTTEISAETRMVVLPGDPGNVGERYGHADQLPLQATTVGGPAIDPTTIAITGDTSGKIGGHARLEATLSDALGPVSDAPLHFSFQGTNYEATTDAQGKAAVANVPIAGPVGETDLFVNYDGDGLLRSPSYTRVGFVVSKADVSLAFDPASESTGKVNHTAHFAAKLTDASGPVSGATLRFTFQGASYAATTGSNGVASTDVTVKGPTGNTTLTVSFDGDATHPAAEASSPFTVTRDDSTALAFDPASDTSGKANHTAHFAAKLTDSSGPIAGAPLTFSFQGASYGATTDSSGVGSTNVTVKGPPGDTSLTVSFDGDATRAAASASRTFTVVRDDTALSFEPTSASSGKIDDRATFIAKLRDSSGVVAGAMLHFDVQSATYDARTNNEGTATVSVVMKGPAGDYTVHVRSDGDSTRSPSSADAPFTVTKRSSSISFTAKDASANNVVVDAMLTDTDSTAGLASRTVNVFVDGKQKASAITGSGGHATVTFKLSSPKGRIFRVEFSSDDTYVGTAAEAKFNKNGASGSS